MNILKMEHGSSMMIVRIWKDLELIAKFSAPELITQRWFNEMNRTLASGVVRVEIQ